MATAKKPAKADKTAKAAPIDSRGLVRVYIDLPRHLSHELGVMAIRRDLSKRAMLAIMVEHAITGRPLPPPKA
jgi:hypothetical protein